MFNNKEIANLQSQVAELQAVVRQLEHANKMYVGRAERDIPLRTVVQMIMTRLGVKLTADDPTIRLTEISK